MSAIPQQEKEWQYCRGWKNLQIETVAHAYSPLFQNIISILLSFPKNEVCNQHCKFLKLLLNFETAATSTALQIIQMKEESCAIVLSFVNFALSYKLYIFHWLLYILGWRATVRQATGRSVKCNNKLSPYSSLFRYFECCQVFKYSNLEI
jgi:hypothetical protein